MFVLQLSFIRECPCIIPILNNSIDKQVTVITPNPYYNNANTEGKHPHFCCFASLQSWLFEVKTTKVFVNEEVQLLATATCLQLKGLKAELLSCENLVNNVITTEVQFLVRLIKEPAL
jgi:hypothetical protein